MGDGPRAIYLPDRLQRFAVRQCRPRVVADARSARLGRLPLLVPIAGSLVCGLSGGASAIAGDAGVARFCDRPRVRSGRLRGAGRFRARRFPGVPPGSKAAGSSARRGAIKPEYANARRRRAGEDNHVDTVDLSKAAPPHRWHLEAEPEAALRPGDARDGAAGHRADRLHDRRDRRRLEPPVAAFAARGDRRDHPAHRRALRPETFVLIALLTRASPDAIGMNAPHTALGLILLGFRHGVVAAAQGAPREPLSDLGPGHRLTWCSSSSPSRA